MTEERKLHKEESASAGQTENEEIIELTDEIKAAPKNGEEIIELTDEIKTAPNDADEIIELVDEVVKPVSTVPADNAGGAAREEPAVSGAPEMNTGSEETNASEAAPEASPDGEIMIGADIEEDLEIEEDEQDDFVNSLGMDLETNSAISQLPEEQDAVSAAEPSESAPLISEAVSSDQIEAAVERVVMKILPEKIDSLLSAAVEKTLAREIDKIKAVLLDESSGETI